MLWNDYALLLRRALEHGEPHADRTGVGTFSLAGAELKHEMSDWHPLLTARRISMRWVAEELRWMLSGSTNEQDLAAKGVPLWSPWATKEKCAKWSRQAGDLGPTYGKLLRAYPLGSNEGGFDQMAALYTDLRDSPNSRRHVVTLWHPQCARRVDVPPCCLSWQFKVVNDKLDLHVTCRSSDLVLGLPYDLAQWGLLLMLTCSLVDLSPGLLRVSIADAHVYLNHVDAVRELLERLESNDLPPSSRLIMTDVKSWTEWTWEWTHEYKHMGPLKAVTEIAV